MQTAQLLSTAWIIGLNDLSSPTKGSSPVRSRLANWAPCRPASEEVAEKITLATERRDEILAFKKSSAARKNKAPAVHCMKITEAEKLASEIAKKIALASERRDEFLASKKSAAARENKAAAVNTMKIAEAEKLACEIAKKVDSALARAEAHKREAAAKGSKMAASKVDIVKQKATEIAAMMRSEQSKRHAAAVARADSCKKDVATKGTRMCVPMVHLVKKKTIETTKEMEAEQARRHAAAIARAEARKAEIAEKGSKMAASKIDDLRKKEEASIALTREMNEKRHAAAIARAEARKAEIAARCGEYIAKVEAARSQHWNDWRAELKVMTELNKERQAIAAARVLEFQASRAAKAIRMSGSSGLKKNDESAGITEDSFDDKENTIPLIERLEFALPPPPPTQAESHAGAAEPAKAPV